MNGMMKVWIARRGDEILGVYFSAEDAWKRVHEALDADALSYTVTAHEVEGDEA